MLEICSCVGGYHHVLCPFFRPILTELPMAPQVGWICPKCQAGVSPNLSICPCNEGAGIQVEVTWNQILKITCTDSANLPSNSKLTIMLGNPECPSDILDGVERLQEMTGLDVGIIPSGIATTSSFPYPSARYVDGDRVIDEGYGHEGVLALLHRLASKNDVSSS